MSEEQKPAEDSTIQNVAEVVKDGVQSLADVTEKLLDDLDEGLKNAKEKVRTFVNDALD